MVPRNSVIGCTKQCFGGDCKRLVRLLWPVARPLPSAHPPSLFPIPVLLLIAVAVRTYQAQASSVGNRRRLVPGTGVRYDTQ